MTDKLRVFVADDSPVARNMLIRMLNDEDDIEIVGEAGTTQSSIMMLDEVNPDVILLEAAISGGMSITRLIRSMKDIKPYVRIILCVEVNDGVELIKSAELWASDIIRKPYNKTNLLRAIRSA
ncbi:MAG: response regulator [Clostridiales bacterium]|nr:response regulator [Clostridiales bacterium]